MARASAHLTATFAEANDALADWLGRDIPWNDPVARAAASPEVAGSARMPSKDVTKATTNRSRTPEVPPAW
jgi:hypothetical protein